MEAKIPRFFESWKLPDISKIDLLVVMGGPMSANDEEKLAWLPAEKQFIHDAVKGGRLSWVFAWARNLLPAQWVPEFTQILSRKSGGFRYKTFHRYIIRPSDSRP